MLSSYFPSLRISNFLHNSFLRLFRVLLCGLIQYEFKLSFLSKIHLMTLEYKSYKYTKILLFLAIIVIYFSHAVYFFSIKTTGNGCTCMISTMESDNNRQLINSLKQLNPMSAAENVLSMRKISHRAN